MGWPCAGKRILKDQFQFSAGSNQASRDIYTVSRLNREVKTLLERQLGGIWIEGELSNLTLARSGHWYFSLKDDGAQTSCAMFKSRNSLLGFKPSEGNHVILRARVGLYEPRGQFQLLVEHMELAGEGMLQIKFEQLKRKLSEEGLFATETKQVLPTWPNRIGIVTSPSGAAIRDIVTVLARRNPAIEVVLYPALVQGNNSAPELARAIKLANTRAECDVLIVGRGGGSLEDLWAFNEETVARAIFSSNIPVISAVGHEIDFTIADLVADVRAPTPSASAEICSPDREEALRMLKTMENRMDKAMLRKKAALADQLRHLYARLEHPGRQLEQFQQRIDELMQRVPVALSHGIQLRLSSLATLRARIIACNPQHRIKQYEERIVNTKRRFISTVQTALESRKAAIGECIRALRAVSPQSTLRRGYAIVTGADGAIARDAKTFEAGDQVSATLAKGQLLLSVESIEDRSVVELEITGEIEP